MIRRGILVIVALILLSSTIILVEFSPVVSGNPMMFDALFGEKAPPGITIYGNGTVDGTDRIIQADDRNYMLTSDISESVTILRDGIILNGTGHTLHGKSGQIGIFIQGRNGITITNLGIEGFEYGIKLTWRHYGDYDGRTIAITDNIFRGNKNAISFSDHLQGSNITDNSFIANTYCVSGAVGIVFRGNRFIDNEYCMPPDEGSLNEVDTSNMVNNKPVYYWINEQDKTVPSDAGWVVLKNCKNITVQGLNITRFGGEVQLYNTTGSTIRENSLSKSGISLQRSKGNVIEENKIVSSLHYGVSLKSSGENRITNNQIIDNIEGVHMESCNNNTISQNLLTSNSVAGLYMSFSYLNGSSSTTLVSQNVISKNGIGIHIYSSNSATIVLNNITGNLDWGMKLENNPKNNDIHHNNFIGNNVTDKLQVCITGFWIQTDNGSSINGKYTPPRKAFVAGEANNWNNTLDGNYWSDYTPRYPNATEVDNTGVGNTPYYINENNIDQHPLLAPVDIADTNLLSPYQGAASEDIWSGVTQSIPVLLAIASVAIVGLGLAVFFSKRRRRVGLNFNLHANPESKV